jgi:putative membrane protein
MMKNHPFLMALGVLTFVTHSAVAGMLGVSESDQTIMNKLNQGSISEIHTAQTVIQRSSEPEVKQLAQRIIDDHTTLMKEIQSWADKNKVQLSSTAESEPNKMSSLTSANFDQRYVQAMLEDHNKDVSDVAKYIDEHPKSSVTPILKKNLPNLEDHLRIAENAAGKIGLKPDLGLNHKTRETA